MSSTATASSASLSEAGGSTLPLGGGVHTTDFHIDLYACLQYLDLLPLPPTAPAGNKDGDIASSSSSPRSPLSTEELQSLFPPTYSTLNLIHRAFLFKIPFENLNLHFQCKQPIEVDNPSTLQDKLLVQRRGGYCFELNQYFHYLLRALQFHVEIKLARVIWLRDYQAPSARTHFINLVHLPAESSHGSSRTYICDVSFGGAGYLSPLHFQCETIQSQELANYRIVAVDPLMTPDPYFQAKGHYGIEVQSKVADHANNWQVMYYFNLYEMVTLSDIIVSNFYVANHPLSVFINNIMMTKVHHCPHTSTITKYTLLNADMKEVQCTIDKEGKEHVHQTQSTIMSEVEFRQVLQDKFGIVLAENKRVIVPNTHW